MRTVYYAIIDWAAVNPGKIFVLSLIVCFCLGVLTSKIFW